MKKVIYTSFTSFFILASASAWGKALRNPQMTEMKNGRPTETALKDVRQEVALAEKMDSDRFNEVALDPSKAKTDTEVIAALSAREVFVLVDQSGSMGSGDANPTGKWSMSWSRWNSAEVAVQGLAETILALDRDGEIPLYFFEGYHVNSVTVKTTQDIAQAFKKRGPAGSTPLADALEKVRREHLDELLRKSEPFTVVVLTDGVPDDKVRVEQFFKNLVRDHNLTDKKRERLAAFTFVRQGDDSGAIQFLEYLDDDLKKKIGVDIIDTKEDNFVFGNQKGYRGAQGPIELLRQAVDD